MKPNREGETGVIPGIPYPRSDTMEVRLGSTTESGLKAMVSLASSIFPNSRGEVYAYLDKQLVPHQAWTTVSGITIRGLLLPDSVIMPPELPELKAPGPTAARRSPAVTDVRLPGDRFLVDEPGPMNKIIIDFLPRSLKN
jgi:hypothetical protein